MATRSEPSESFAMPNGKSRPLANVVIRKSLALTPGPWTVNGCPKAVPRQRNAVNIVTVKRTMCPEDINELDFAIMIVQACWMRGFARSVASGSIDPARKPYIISFEDAPGEGCINVLPGCFAG